MIPNAVSPPEVRRNATGTARSSIFVITSCHQSLRILSVYLIASPKTTVPPVFLKIIFLKEASVLRDYLKTMRKFRIPGRYPLPVALLVGSVVQKQKNNC